MESADAAELSRIRADGFDDALLVSVAVSAAAMMLATSRCKSGICSGFSGQSGIRSCQQNLARNADNA